MELSGAGFCGYMTLPGGLTPPRQCSQSGAVPSEGILISYARHVESAAQREAQSALLVELLVRVFEPEPMTL